MFYRKACLTGFALLEDTSNMRTGLTGGMSYRRPCVT